MPLTKSKSLLYQIIKYISLGYTIAYEIGRYQSIYISGGGHTQVLEIKKTKELKQWHEGIRQLKRSHFVANKKLGDKLIITLTNKSKRLSLIQNIKNSTSAPTGKSTLVVFDIPEQARSARDEFRSFLKNVDFVQMQKSVWLLEKDVVSEIENLINELRIKTWVRVFLAEVVN